MKKNKLTALISTAMACICAINFTACSDKETTVAQDVVLMTEGAAYQQTVKGDPVAYTSHYFDVTGGKVQNLKTVKLLIPLAYDTPCLLLLISSV